MFKIGSSRRVLERQLIANRVAHFYSEIANYNKVETVNHFIKEGLKRRTIYDILKRFETYGTSDFKKKTDRKSVKTTRAMKNRIVKLFTNSNWSKRKIANQVKTQNTIVRRIKIHNNIKTNKCKYIPKYTDNQLKRAKYNCW